MISIVALEPNDFSTFKDVLANTVK